MTDAVLVEVGAWQARTLEPMYTVVFVEALRVKIREDVRTRRCAYLFAMRPIGRS